MIRKIKLSDRSFTLAELLLACAILAFVLTGLLSLFINCSILNETNRNLSIATSHAQYIMEEIKAAGFTGLEAKIESNNGTPAGWDLNTAQIGSAPYNLMPLDTEAINTSVFQSGDPLGVSVRVNYRDRGQKDRQIELRTFVTGYS